VHNSDVIDFVKEMSGIVWTTVWSIAVVLNLCKFLCRLWNISCFFQPSRWYGITGLCLDVFQSRKFTLAGFESK